MVNVIYDGHLDRLSIDKISKTVVSVLEESNVNGKDILKIRLGIEGALEIWVNELGEQMSCQLLQVRRFGKTSLTLRVNGASVDPTSYQDDLFLSISGNNNMLAALELPVAYYYVHGTNELRIRIPAENDDSVKKLVIAILVAIVLGLGIRFAVNDFALSLSALLIAPLMDTIIKVLNLIAGPMICLSVISGITGVGDTISFGKIGTALVKRFLIMSFILTIITWLPLSFFFPVSSQGSTAAGEAFSGILGMLLDIIPKDIVSPFQTGNAMQIIFLAVCFGCVCIMLGSAVPDLVNNINQLNVVVQKLMIGVSKLLPVLVFLCVFNLVLSSDISVISQIVFPMLTILVMTVLIPLCYCLYCSLAVHVPFGRLIHYFLPTYIIALTTASSAASFGTNVECCINDLKIDRKLVNFGVPFGQVLFKAGTIVLLPVLALFMSKQYGVAINAQWIITMLIMVPILAVATPPVPGGDIPSTLILFSQLGIPASAMAICTTIITFADYFVTGCSITCLQQELMVSAKKLDMLD